MTQVFQLFLLALLASLIALVGGVVFLFNQRWSRSLERNAVPFAAGVLITISLLGLLPESMELIGTRTLWVAAAAFAATFVFERLAFEIHHHTHKHSSQRAVARQAAVPMVLIGDTIHNFVDGVAISSAFLVNPGLGLLTAVSTFLHEVPHEIGDFGILLKAGWKRADILLANALSASTTILGAFALLVFADDPQLIGTLLAVSAGIFLYLGSIDFLPHAADGFSSKAQAAVPLLIGVLVMAAAFVVVPHAG